MTYTNGIPPVSDYSHWNEDAQRVWYEENKYDMEHPEVFDDYSMEQYERDFVPDDYEIDPDTCAVENDYHQRNTAGRTILFAGIEVYDQQECSDCWIALSEEWPRLAR